MWVTCAKTVMCINQLLVFGLLLLQGSSARELSENTQPGQRCQKPVLHVVDGLREDVFVCTADNSGWTHYSSCFDQCVRNEDGYKMICDLFSLRRCWLSSGEIGEGIPANDDSEDKECGGLTDGLLVSQKDYKVCMKGRRVSNVTDWCRYHYPCVISLSDAVMRCGAEVNPVYGLFCAVPDIESFSRSEKVRIKTLLSSMTKTGVQNSDIWPLFMGDLIHFLEIEQFQTEDMQDVPFYAHSHNDTLSKIVQPPSGRKLNYTKPSMWTNQVHVQYKSGGMLKRPNNALQIKHVSVDEARDQDTSRLSDRKGISKASRRSSQYRQRRNDGQQKTIVVNKPLNGTREGKRITLGLPEPPPNINEVVIITNDKAAEKHQQQAKYAADIQQSENVASSFNYTTGMTTRPSFERSPDLQNTSSSHEVDRTLNNLSMNKPLDKSTLFLSPTSDERPKSENNTEPIAVQSRKLVIATGIYPKPSVLNAYQSSSNSSHDISNSNKESSAESDKGSVKAFSESVRANNISDILVAGQGDKTKAQQLQFDKQFHALLTRLVRLLDPNRGNKGKSTVQKTTLPAAPISSATTKSSHIRTEDNVIDQLETLIQLYSQLIGLRPNEPRNLNHSSKSPETPSLHDNQSKIFDLQKPLNIIRRFFGTIPKNGEEIQVRFHFAVEEKPPNDPTAKNDMTETSMKDDSSDFKPVPRRRMEQEKNTEGKLFNPWRESRRKLFVTKLRRLGEKRDKRENRTGVQTDQTGSSNVKHQLPPVFGSGGMIGPLPVPLPLMPPPPEPPFSILPAQRSPNDDISFKRPLGQPKVKGNAKQAPFGDKPTMIKMKTVPTSAEDVGSILPNVAYVGSSFDPGRLRSEGPPVLITFSEVSLTSERSPPRFRWKGKSFDDNLGTSATSIHNHRFTDLLEHSPVRRNPFVLISKLTRKVPDKQNGGNGLSTEKRLEPGISFAAAVKERNDKRTHIDSRPYEEKYNRGIEANRTALQRADLTGHRIHQTIRKRPGIFDAPIADDITRSSILPRRPLAEANQISRASYNMNTLDNSLQNIPKTSLVKHPFESQEIMHSNDFPEIQALQHSRVFPYFEDTKESLVQTSENLKNRYDSMAFDISAREDEKMVSNLSHGTTLKKHDLPILMDEVHRAAAEEIYPHGVVVIPENVNEQKHASSATGMSHGSETGALTLQGPVSMDVGTARDMRQRGEQSVVSNDHKPVSVFTGEEYQQEINNSDKHGPQTPTRFFYNKTENVSMTQPIETFGSVDTDSTPAKRLRDREDEFIRHVKMNQEHSFSPREQPSPAPKRSVERRAASPHHSHSGIGHGLQTSD